MHIVTKSLLGLTVIGLVVGGILSPADSPPSTASSASGTPPGYEESLQARKAEAVLAIQREVQTNAEAFLREPVGDKAWVERGEALAKDLRMQPNSVELQALLTRWRASSAVQKGVELTLAREKKEREIVQQQRPKLAEATRKLYRDAVDARLLKARMTAEARIVKGKSGPALEIQWVLMNRVSANDMAIFAEGAAAATFHHLVARNTATGEYWTWDLEPASAPAPASDATLLQSAQKAWFLAP